LHSDTLIETKNGIKHIKDIKAETEHQDYVLGNDGIFHKVLDTIYRDLDEYYELHSSYNIPVKVSAEHPFYVTDGINQPYWSNVVDLIGKSNMYVAMRKPVIDDNPHLNEHISNLIDMSNPNYIVDGDLIYDKCGYSPTAKLWSISSVMKKYSVTKNSAEKAISLLTKDITLKNEGIIDLARQMKFDGFVKNQPIKINNEFEITEELAEVFGWYLAEGSNEKGNRIEFSLNGTLIGSKAKFIQDTLYKTFNVTSIVEMSGINKCRVRVSSGILSELFGNLFGIHAENKKVPNFLYQHQRFAKSLIKGYLLGDGHISEKRSHVSYCSKSKSLAFQIRSMMLKFGIMSSLSYSEKRNIYNVVVTRDSLPNIKSILGNELVFRNENTRKHRPNYIETDTHYFVPITSIAKIKLPITQKFYDLCVDETHSFVANGIVCHNTTTEAMAVGLPIVAPLHTSIKEICENGAACYPVSILSEQILTHDYENVRFIPDPVNTAFAMTQAYNDVIEGKFPHKNAYTDILAEYDWDKIAEQWKQIFSKYL
jgi:intein/homing endonuclease